MSGKFLIGIVGVVLILYLSVEKPSDYPAVLNALECATYKVGFMIAFVFCALSGAVSFGEDLECRYMRYMVIRHAPLPYVFQKLMVCFFSAFLTMVLGVVIFCLIYHVWYPFEMEYTCEIMLGCGYEGLYENGYYMVWIFLCGIQWGIGAGCFAVAAAVLSLFVANRMLILALPAFLYQILTELMPSNLSYLQPAIVFNAFFGLYHNTTKMAFCMLAWCVVFFAVGTMVGYLQLKKRV